MNLIETAIHFHVCICKTHADLVLPDGTREGPFTDKVKAFNVVAELHAAGRVTDEEKGILFEQIGKADHLGDVSPATLLFLTVTKSPSLFHKHLEEERHEGWH